MRSKNIKKWMIDNDVSQLQIKRDAGVSRTLVSLYIKGERVTGEKAEKVKDAFLQLGCPWELLEVTK